MFLRDANHTVNLSRVEVSAIVYSSNSELMNGCFRWLFIVCVSVSVGIYGFRGIHGRFDDMQGCMTLPCALGVLLILPDLPSNTRAWYLTDEEKKYALERSLALGKVRALVTPQTTSQCSWFGSVTARRQEAQLDADQAHVFVVE